jgi:hypothetical protein
MLYRELLADRERLLGPDHPEALAARNNLCHWLAKTGKNKEALRMYEDLVRDSERILGPDHLDTLRIRANYAVGLANTGKRAEGLAILKEIVSERERILGPDHPDSQALRKTIEILSKPGAKGSSSPFSRFVRWVLRLIRDL